MAASEDPTEPTISDIEKSARDAPTEAKLQAQDHRDPPVTEPATEKSWKTEEQILPKNNLPLVFFSLLLTTFLVSAPAPACLARSDTSTPKHPAGGTGSNYVRIPALHISRDG